MKKSEPWYIHGILYVIIAVLIYILIRVAVIEPSETIAIETYNRTESHLRMDNIRQAEILWEKEHGKFIDSLDVLVNYVKTDTTVKKLMEGIDTLTNRSTNPFKNLTSGTFEPDSLLYSPKSHSPYILKVDTVVTVDTIITPRGDISKIDTNIVIGSKYLLECPDGYGRIGDLENPALKNAASWE